MEGSTEGRSDEARQWHHVVHGQVKPLSPEDGNLACQLWRDC